MPSEPTYEELAAKVKALELKLGIRKPETQSMAGKSKGSYLGDKTTATALSKKSCPYCNSQVREDRLERHMSSSCPYRLSKPATVNRPSRRKRRRKKKKTATKAHFVQGGLPGLGRRG
jgi:hypothetical protein